MERNLLILSGGRTCTEFMMVQKQLDVCRRLLPWEGKGPRITGNHISEITAQEQVRVTAVEVGSLWLKAFLCMLGFVEVTVFMYFQVSPKLVSITANVPIGKK